MKYFAAGKNFGIFTKKNWDICVENWLDVAIKKGKNCRD